MFCPNLVAASVVAQQIGAVFTPCFLMNTFSTRRTQEVISSRNHPLIKKIRGLHLRSERERSGLFYIEGVRFIAQTLAQKVAVDTLIYAPSLLTNSVGVRLVREQKRAGGRCLEVTPEVLHSISLNDDPQGIGAIVPQRWTKLENIEPSRDLCWIALETVQSAGNLGTIVRTSEAVSGAGIILIGDNADVYDPATVRASMGAMFSQRFVRTSMSEFLTWKAQQGCLLVGTSPSAKTVYHEVELRAPLVLFMGWERKGLSVEQQNACDIMVKLPMIGKSDSLNLAVATGVMLYEVLRQSQVRQSQVRQNAMQRIEYSNRV